MLRAASHRARRDPVARHLLRLASAASLTAMDRSHAQFVRPGDLVFDIGAHVGDRVASFRRLGAQVVAVEPQPAFARRCACSTARDENVEIVRSRGRPHRSATIRLMINVDNPTVSTASDAFVNAADGATGWRGPATGTRSIRVPMTTLDALIARHGVPSFIKIDVEGFEAEALAGTDTAGRRRCRSSLPPSSATWRAPASSAARRSASTRFNAALGESQQLGEWRSADAIGRLARRAAARGQFRETSMRSGVKRLRPLFCCLARRGAALAADDLAVDVHQRQRTDTAAPRRTTSISSCNSPEVRRFTVEAVHPNYIGTIVTDRSALGLHQLRHVEPTRRSTPRSRARDDLRDAGVAACRADHSRTSGARTRCRCASATASRPACSCCSSGPATRSAPRRCWCSIRPTATGARVRCRRRT